MSTFLWTGHWQILSHINFITQSYSPGTVEGAETITCRYHISSPGGTCPGGGGGSAWEAKHREIQTWQNQELWQARFTLLTHWIQTGCIRGQLQNKLVSTVPSQACSNTRIPLISGQLDPLVTQLLVYLLNAEDIVSNFLAKIGYDTHK